MAKPHEIKNKTVFYPRDLNYLMKSNYQIRTGTAKRFQPKRRMYVTSPPELLAITISIRFLYSIANEKIIGIISIKFCDLGNGHGLFWGEKIRKGLCEKTSG